MWRWIKIFSPICFLNHYGNKLELKINSVKYGHNTLCWYPQNKIENLQSQNLLTENLLLANFESNAKYFFYTKNSATGEKSVEMSVQTIDETADDFSEKIIKYIGEVEDDDTLTAAMSQIEIFNPAGMQINSLKSFLPITILQNYFENIPDAEDKELFTCCQLMQVLERYFNMQNVVMNRDAEVPIEIIYGFNLKLKFVSQINKIAVYKVRNGQKIFFKNYSTATAEQVNLFLPPNELYQIFCFARNDLVYSFWHYQFDEVLNAWLWTEKNKILQDTEDAMKNNLNLGNISLELTDDEINFYLSEKNFNPTNYVGARPALQSIYQGKIYFNIDCWDFLKTAEQKFYLTAKADDLLFSKGCENTSIITSDTAVLDYSSRLIDGNTLFYISDDKGTPITKVFRYSFQNAEQIDIEDYNEKLRQIEFGEYENRLLKNVRLRIPEAVETVKTFLADLKNSDTQQTENIWLDLITKTNSTVCHFDKLLLYYAILEEQNTRFNYDLNFFNHKINYAQKQDVFAFPTRNVPYLLTVIKMNEFDNVQVEHFHSKNNTIDIQTREFDFYFMFATDLETYKRSGVILFKKDKVNKILKCNIDIKGVD